MVEQAGDEVGRPTADRQAVALDQLEHAGRVPDVAQIDRGALEHRDQERAEHADEVPDRGGGELPAAVGRVVREQLAGLEAERLMAVDDALRVAGRARGEGDQRRAGRIGARRCRPSARRRADRRRCSRASSRPDQPTIGTSAHRSGWYFIRPNSLGGDEHLRPRGGQDVAEFLAAVEVHDRHDHRAEERRRPERRRRLHPVRQLERDDVAGPDAARAQSGGEPARLAVRRRRRCRRTAAPRSAHGTPASGLACSPPARRSPRVSWVHHPSSS